MLKKIFFFLLCFYFVSFSASAKDRYIYFIENYQYDDLYEYNTIKNIINNSVKGLAIQRNGGCEFAFFYSISKKHPSNISIEETPLYNRDESINNMFFKGFVEKDGTLYVPSKFLVYGQTFLEDKKQNEEKIFIEHIQDLQKLNNEIESININKETEIIISSWNTIDDKKFQQYIMPFIYYNNKNRGIFYSQTTRNMGILDYENINSILSGDISRLSIMDGDINKIYKDRAQGLKNKRIFLINYGYCMSILTIINSILLMLKSKRFAAFSSSFVIATPLIILIEPIINISGLINKIAVIILLTVILSIGLIHEHIKKIAIVFLMLIYLDAISFRFLLKNSLLSYEPALGARFYGIGNEFLGVIIAYTLILISEYKFKNQWTIWFANAGFLLLEGGGSNFGGFLTCGVIGFNISPLPIKLFEILSAFAIIYVSNNHIGVFFRNLAGFNTGYLYATLFSKLYTFKRLLRVNIWTGIITVSALIYLYNLLKGRLKFNGNTKVFVISCILVVIFNDSGIVSCALIMMVYLNYIFYKLSVEENNGI